MNLENLALLRDAVLTGDGKPDIGFYVGAWSSRMPREETINPRQCKTAACFGGWCTIISRPEFWSDEYREFVGDPRHIGNTAAFLGISEDAAKRLCIPWDYWHIREESLTPELAVKVLDYLRDNGVVDYSEALGEDFARRLPRSWGQENT